MRLADIQPPRRTAATRALGLSSKSSKSDPIRDSAVVGSAFTKKVKDRAARPRKGFLAHLDNSDETSPLETPLYTILSARKGAPLRLKLYLTLILVGVAKPHSVVAPAATYARLFGLPKTSGPRAVNDALSWLSEKELISLDDVKGVPRTATLLSDLGTGDPYDLPTGARNKPWATESYFHVPPTLWSQGWMAVLGSAELSMLLILLNETRRESETGIFFGSNEFKDRYGLSESLRHRGTKGLIDLGLVVKRTGLASRGPFEVERKRSILTLRLEVLDPSV